MIKRITIGDLRLTFTAARITKIIGVNSNLPAGGHILMWDFDEVSLNDVKIELRKVQTRYWLSDIFILRSSKPSNYIAYCFTALSWRRVVEIIAQTNLVDWNFFKYGVYRGHFTLRVTPKSGRTPKLVAKLEGSMPPDVEPSDLLSWVRYETVKGR